jgi:hypothetical protein
MPAPVAAISPRRWRLLAALSVLAAFTLFHFTAFGAAVRRYQRAIAAAQDLNLVAGPQRALRVLPPRVSALVSANALASPVAEQRGGSGVLASDVVGELTSIAAKHGMDVLLAEPGMVVDKPSSVEAQSHLRLACGYWELAGFLDDLSRADRLFAVERFNFVSATGGRAEVELWLSRLILKRGADAR